LISGLKKVEEQELEDGNLIHIDDDTDEVANGVMA
jgi:hypothetical protein